MVCFMLRAPWFRMKLRVRSSDAAIALTNLATADTAKADRDKTREGKRKRKAETTAEKAEKVTLRRSPRKLKPTQKGEKPEADTEEGGETSKDEVNAANKAKETGGLNEVWYDQDIATLLVRSTSPISPYSQQKQSLLKDLDIDTVSMTKWAEKQRNNGNLSLMFSTNLGAEYNEAKQEDTGRAHMYLQHNGDLDTEEDDEMKQKIKQHRASFTNSKDPAVQKIKDTVAEITKLVGCTVPSGPRVVELLWSAPLATAQVPHVDCAGRNLNVMVHLTPHDGTALMRPSRDKKELQGYAKLRRGGDVTFFWTNEPHYGPPNLRETDRYCIFLSYGPHPTNAPLRWRSKRSG